MLNGCAYILTVDVGNTFIRFGLFAEDSAAAQECPLATCEITTPSSITADEARMRLTQVMGALSADAGMPGELVPAAAVLSCVVPALERPWKAALSRTCTDLGTTTNIEVIDARGTFVGGVIAPGLALGARSLSAAAARLPQVEPSAPTHVIGRNTREAMRSGVVLGEVARIDGMLDMVLAEMRATKAAGEGDVPIVITGDDALPHQPKAPPRVKSEGAGGTNVSTFHLLQWVKLLRLRRCLPCRTIFIKLRQASAWTLLAGTSSL